ncbi:MAG: helix-turn-helix domain-containing protein [Allomuricauda sp.]
MHKVRNQKVMSMFGQNVRSIRVKKSITQEQLAEDAGISQVQVARIESGKINTSISTVVALAKALDVEEGSFFNKTSLG